jgi:DNA-binding transcriptional LysR family regulator
MRNTNPCVISKIGTMNVGRKNAAPNWLGESPEALARVRAARGPLEVAVSGPLIVNDVPTMLSAALGGVGLAQVPEPMAIEHLAAGELEEVLPEHAPSSPGMFLYFPSRTQVMPKLRAFVDHVKAYAAAVLLDPARRARPTKGGQRAPARQRR